MESDRQATPSLSFIFKLVWRGYTTGTCVIFVPIILLMVVIVAFLETESSIAEAIIGLIMTPVILALQGVMIGAVVIFGLWIYPTGWAWKSRQNKHQA